MDKNYSKTLTALKAERALCILTNRVDKIADVKSWASEAKISRRWLCIIMKQQFGKSPKKILREMRFSIIIKCLNEDLEMTGYCVALEAGLKDEKALYKFLSTHFDTSLTTIRKEILQDLLEY